MTATATARVLIVEDHAALANVLRFNLQTAGFQPEVVTDGRKALDRCLTGEDVDLILLDQQLPGMLGLDFCAAIRKEPRFRDVPVIMLTAKQLELDHDELKQRYKIAEVFGKPFSPSEVVNSVLEIMEVHMASEKGASPT